VLHGRAEFTLDDITRAMIERNNVTSQGAIGDEALRRSTRADRSRDPLYNQSKMYAELYRTLGWIQSTTSSLTFAFSFLGEHVAGAKDPNPLVRECLLGIAYPNEVLEVQTEQKIRVVGTILLTMAALGVITRDELIAGPMSMKDDTNRSAFDDMVRTLASCRKQKGALDKVIERIAKQRGIQRHPTMENYTRFPIAVFPWSGWALKPKGAVLQITDAGKDAAAKLRSATDIRLDDFNKLPPGVQSSIIRFTFYQMLGRAGFDLHPVASSLSQDEAILSKHGFNLRAIVLFSPFQQLSRERIAKLTPDLVFTREIQAAKTSESLLAAFQAGATPSRERPLLEYKLSDDAIEIDTLVKPVAEQLRAEYSASGKNATKVVERFARAHSRANQDIFYPFVADLFRILGFDCQTSRRGVNYARADALIIDPKESIPLEIKSPGEETEISVKAIRQALENKIVLLSRKGYPTLMESTSLVVGYNVPNERSEVHELVNDIRKAFNIRVGVIDIRSLLMLCVTSLATGKKLDLKGLRRLQGVIRV
jgi:hypothetical protein